MRTRERRRGRGISRRRLAWTAAGLVAGIWVAWQIIGNTAADTLARHDPQAALGWRSGHSEALARLAARELRQAEPGSALSAIEARARTALAANPLERSAWRTLAIAADLEGEPEPASSLVAVAGRRSMRDPAVETWLLRERLEAGAFADAVDHADALLRTGGLPGVRMAPILIAMALDERSRPAVIERLAADPPWRGWFLAALSKAAALPDVFAVYRALGDSRLPPRDGEIAPMLARFVDEGAFDLAFLAWLHFLPEDRRGEIPYVYNGGFEQPVTGLPFDWTVGAVRGAATRVVEEDGSRVLRVEFANTRVGYRHVSKLLLLPPGGYRLSGRERADDLRTERGMNWRLTCADGEKQVLAATPLLVGTTPWRPIDTAFEVPQTGCEAQWLQLELAVRATLDREVGGLVAYDDLAVERAPAVTN